MRLPLLLRAATTSRRHVLGALGRRQGRYALTLSERRHGVDVELSERWTMEELHEPEGSADAHGTHAGELTAL